MFRIGFPASKGGIGPVSLATCPPEPTARRDVTRPIRVLPEQPAPAGRLFALSDDRVGITAHLAAVDDCLTLTMQTLSRRWAELVDGRGTDVLGDADLPELLGTLLASGGKRIRPTMSYLGWAAGGGPAPTGAADRHGRRRAGNCCTCSPWSTTT